MTVKEGRREVEGRKEEVKEGMWRGRKESGGSKEVEK
jgi:hypothetical protein